MEIVVIYQFMEISRWCPIGRKLISHWCAIVVQLYGMLPIPGRVGVCQLPFFFNASHSVYINIMRQAPYLLFLLDSLHLWQLDTSLDDTGWDAPPPSTLQPHWDVLHLSYLPPSNRKGTQLSYSHGSKSYLKLNLLQI